MGFRDMMARRQKGQSELDQELAGEAGDSDATGYSYSEDLGAPENTPPDPRDTGKPQEREEESVIQDAAPDSPEALAALSGSVGSDIPDFGTNEPGPEEPGQEEPGEPTDQPGAPEPPGDDQNAAAVGGGLAGSPTGIPAAPPMVPPAQPPPPPGNPPGVEAGDPALAAARRRVAERMVGGGGAGGGV